MTAVMVNLSEIIQPAKTVRAGRVDYPILSMTMHDGLVDQGAKFKKRIASADTSPYKVVRRNQLVVGFPIDEGVLSFQQLHDAAIVSPAYDVWDIRDSARVEPAYLERFLRSPTALVYYRTKLRGTTARRRSIPDEVFLRLPVPLPPFNEQRRIAAILAKAEELRAKRRAALSQLESLTQSIFLDMFGDSVSNRGSWPLARVEDVAEVLTGFPFRSGDYVAAGESIRLCRGANVLPGRLDWTDLASWPESRVNEVAPFMIERGDILIAMDRPWISEGFKIVQAQPRDCPSLLVQRVARIRAQDTSTSGYLLAHLSGPAFKRHCRPTETTVPHISPLEVRSFELPWPPQTIRREFQIRLNRIRDLRDVAAVSLQELGSLFASLQHRAFRGEL